MKTINRAYDSYGQAREAVKALEQGGIASSEISLIANKHVSRDHADVTDVSPAANDAPDTQSDVAEGDATSTS